jgi:ribosomal protein L34
LAHLVTEILQAREFQTTEEDGYLLAKKGSSEVAFCLLGSLDRAAVDGFLSRFKDFNGKKIIATLEPVPTSFVENLDRSVTIWDREALEHEIGRTRIEKVMGDRDHGLVDELVADDYPKIVSPELLENIPEPSVGERIIRPVIGVEDVKELSRQTVAGFRHRLELVPHYVYNYICPLYMGEEKVSVERGTLSINGLTHRVESWSEKSDLVYGLEVAHKRLEPSITVEDAKRLARRELVRVNSYDKEAVREENHVTITEKKKVSPKEDEIVLEDRGVFYIPIWCVEGVHGIMIINAGTGKIVSEDYYRL